MPKPYFPPYGGPYPAAFKPAPPSSPASGSGGLVRASDQSASRGVEANVRRVLEAEIERLHRELEETREKKPQEASLTLHPIPMLWVALVLCFGALLFAVAAVLRHG